MRGDYVLLSTTSSPCAPAIQAPIAPCWEVRVRISRILSAICLVNNSKATFCDSAVQKRSEIVIFSVFSVRKTL